MILKTWDHSKNVSSKCWKSGVDPRRGMGAWWAHALSFCAYVRANMQIDSGSLDQRSTDWATEAVGLEIQGRGFNSQPEPNKFVPHEKLDKITMTGWLVDFIAYETSKCYVRLCVFLELESPVGSRVKHRKTFHFLAFESPRLRENWHPECFFSLWIFPIQWRLLWRPLWRLLRRHFCGD